MLSSKNISLRAIEMEDCQLLKNLMNDPQVSMSVVGWSLPVSCFSQKQWIEANADAASHRLVLVDNKANEAIGVTGLWQIDWHNQTAVSGIKIMPHAQQRGFGSEAIKLCMAWAFYEVGLRRLKASILDFNGASLALYLKKCGWRIEGREKQAIFKKGQWHDLYNIAILKEEFDAVEDSKHFIDLVCPVDTEVKLNLDVKKFI